MSALAEALVAAQRRSLATLEKAYVAGLIEAEPMTAALESCGITDAVDRAFLLASLDILKEWGVAAPNMSERVARENGGPKQATDTNPTWDDFEQALATVDALAARALSLEPRIGDRASREAARASLGL